MLNFAQAFVIAYLCIVPRDAVLRESVASIELNSYYDDSDARLIFQQIIFFDDTNNVIAWRLVKDPAQLPKRDWHGGYVTTWADADTVRQVRTNSLRETWTQYDPETAARETLPQEKRRGLIQQAASEKTH